MPVALRERGGGVRLLLGGAEDRVEDLRLAPVAGQPDLGHGDEAKTRVLDPALEQLGDELGDPFGETARASVAHGGYSSSVKRRCLADSSSISGWPATRRSHWSSSPGGVPGGV